MHPTLLHLGNFTLPTFGVLAAVGLMCGLLLSERTAVPAGVDPQKLWNAGLFAVIAAFLVSRMLLIATNWRAFLAVPVLLLAVPSLTASGIVMTVVATLLWLWAKQVSFRRAFDAWSPCATLVWSFLALGHWAEGSDPGILSRSGWRPPVALYTAAFAAVLTVSACLRLRRRQPSGELAGHVLMAAGFGQFFLCFVRAAGVPLAGLDVLEWVALAMILTGAALAITAGKPKLSAHS